MQAKANLIEKELIPLIKPHQVNGVLIQESKIDIIVELIDTNDIAIQNELSAIIKSHLYANYGDSYLIRIIFNSQKTLESEKIKEKIKIPGIKQMILLASAKGGVGKSTTAANLSLALAKLGFQVGIVDADIYGPSIPTILGVEEKPKVEDNKIIPIHKDGIFSISMGYLIEESQAAIWRGPMISKALSQLLLGTKWPQLDYLVIDMPPGTGDIYLSLAEKFAIDGVVLITTPQKISFSIVKKSISFFNKLKVKIIGLVENMSYFVNPIDNSKISIFGTMLSEIDINDSAVDLLGRIPLSQKINSHADSGNFLENEQEFEIYTEIAKIINDKLKNPK